MATTYGKKTRMSKNKQTYGVWAENSDSDDDAQPSIGSFAGTRKTKKADYTKQMNFVSGGMQGQKKKDGKKDEEQDEYEEESSRRQIESGGESSEDERPSFGGSSGGGSRSSFKPGSGAGRREDQGQIAG